MEITRSKHLMIALMCLVLIGSIQLQAQQPATVRLDGKNLFIPEIRLNNSGTTPVDTVLFIGSWETRGRINVTQNPLATIDTDSNSVIFDLPGKLLPNSKTQVVNREIGRAHV